MITAISPLTAHEAQHMVLEGRVVADGRFGDDGKLWHLGAAVAVGLTLWAIIIDVAFRIFG